MNLTCLKYSLKESTKTSNFSVCFVVFFVIFCSSIIFAPDKENINLNFRIHSPKMIGFHQTGFELYKSFSDPAYVWKKNGDDLGAVVVMAISYWIEQKNTFDVDNIPDTFYFLNIFLLCLFVIVFWNAIALFFNPLFSSIFCSLFVISPFFRFLAFSSDVYLYPLFGFSIILAIIAKSKINKSFFSTIFYIILFVIACFFRSTTFHLSILLPVYIILTKYFKTSSVNQMKKILISFVLIVSAYKTPTIFFTNISHTSWHMLHAGLCEFGCSINKKTDKYYPSVLIDKKLRTSAEYDYYSHWSDIHQYRVVKSINNKAKLFESEYEEILKKDYMNIISHYKFSFVKLLLKRSWRIININPFMHLNMDSYINSSFTDYFFKILSILILVSGIFLNRKIEVFFLLAVFFVLSMAPLFVHSGYLMYNVGSVIVIYLMAFFTLEQIVRNRHYIFYFKRR